MTTKELHHTVQFWIEELEHYDYAELSSKPTPASWSLGQMYMHLIEATDFFLDQAIICVSINDHAHEQSSANAKVMFRNNEFPDKIIEGPPANAFTPEPKNKSEILDGLNKLQIKLGEVESKLLFGGHAGKTRHPGLQYFSANEWLHFADMHLRHHRRQKSRLDRYLQSLNSD
ncbi:MAG: hypothetical protein C5B59_20070 [Bacteroidetes bacterium]|nr:MAG: hypothetical protein C5B59_20070 [Bacteroidota bacterium]